MKNILLTGVVGFIGLEIYNVCTASENYGLFLVLKHELNKDLIDVEFTGSKPVDQFGIIGNNSKLLKKVGNIKYVNINNEIING